MKYTKTAVVPRVIAKPQIQPSSMSKFADGADDHPSATHRPGPSSPSVCGHVRHHLIKYGKICLKYQLLLANNVTSQDFVKFWGNFFSLLYCLRWLEIHRDLKLLSLIESFMWKVFKPSIIFLEELLWEKINSQNTISHPLFKPMQVYLQRSEFQRSFI
jgi:hypothetical protein